LSEGVQAPASPARAHLPDPLRDSADLGCDIERGQADMERAIQLAGLKNDPVLPLIRVLLSSLSLQWRLHDQAVSYFRSASDRLDRQLVDTIAQGERALETRRIGIVESLAPELVKLTTKNARTWTRSVTLKTALTFGGFAVAMALGVGLAGYGAGWQAGHTSALSASGALAGASARCRCGRTPKASPGAEHCIHAYTGGDDDEGRERRHDPCSRREQGEASKG